MSAATRLWEIDHPYYCSEGNYYKNGNHDTYESWADFAQPGSWDKDMSQVGNFLYDFDDDLNFLFRWDWRRTNPSNYEYEIEENPDFELPGDSLLLYYMLQRKARNLSVEIAVTEADEPAVREWLTKRAAYMRLVWEPLLDIEATS